MQSLVKTRIYQMAKATGTPLSQSHIDVLEYAWDYYRHRRVGPLFNNIRRHTGASRRDIEAMFPNGLSSIYTWVGIPIQSTRGGCKPMALLEIDNPREVYFDCNATTPVRREVVDALVAFFQNPRSFGNPSSSYNIGSEAYDLIDRARNRVAACLAVNSGEIYFTGSGSEANNLAIKGIAARHGGGHIITSNVEHPSVMATMGQLEANGFEVTYLPVASDGTLTADQIQALQLKVPADRRERLRVRWGEGCPDCRHTGLYGRTGIFELMDVDRRIRTLVNAGKDASAIAHAARIEGMETLRETALGKLADGITTFEEVLRVTADTE